MYIHIACTKCISFEYVLNIFIPFCYLPFDFIFPISCKYLKFYEVKSVSFFSLGTLGFVVHLLNFLEQLAYFWLLGMSLVTIHRKLSIALNNKEKA